MADSLPELLAGLDIFSELNKRGLNELTASMKQLRYQPGHAMVTEGDSGVGFFVISEGTASVSVEGAEVTTLGPGDYFGEIALLTGGKRTATVTPLSELTCWGIPAWTFRPFVAAHPELASRLRERVERTLDQTDS